jgi:hypothetical protein
MGIMADGTVSVLYRFVEKTSCIGCILFVTGEAKLVVGHAE